MDQPQKPLLEQLRDLLRSRHYSLRTEETYLDWVRRYILFHGKRHPRELGA
ncbi:MAG: integron integrase, partial [Oscillochloris sp.]|nr:integron integrase [Oscillochloris sp.]